MSPATAYCRASLFVLAQFLDGNPVLPLWRNIKFPSRYLFGFLCIGSLNRAEMFGTLADNIDAPAGHLAETPCLPDLAVSAALSSSGAQRTIPFDRADTRINCAHVSSS